MISVIIPTKDRHKDIIRCLNSLENQSMLPNEIIIIDSSEAINKSKELEEKIKKYNKFEIKYQYTDKRGAAVQRNIGINEISKGSEFVFFFDDDVVLEKDYIEVIYKMYKNDIKNEIGGIAGYTLIDGNTVYDGNEKEELIDVKSLYGCCSSYRTSAIKGIFYDENLALYSWLEDWDFSFRVSKKYKLKKCNIAYLYHYHSPSGRVSERKFGFVQIANRNYLYKKNNIFNKREYIFYFGQALKNLVRGYNRIYRERFIGNYIAIKEVVFGNKGINMVKEI